jgi:hypothetical protein
MAVMVYMYPPDTDFIFVITLTMSIVGILCVFGVLIDKIFKKKD